MLTLNYATTMSRLKYFVKLFSTLTKNHPSVVQSLGTGSLMGTGDVIAQTIAEHKRESFKRTLTYVMVGCVIGPIVGRWYKVLDRTFGSAGDTRVALKKIAMDQLLFSPISLFVVVSVLDYSRGREFKQIKKDLRTKYFDILITSYEVWPAVQFINFSFVPLHYRVLFVQSIAVLWNTYLSWKIK